VSRYVLDIEDVGPHSRARRLLLSGDEVIVTARDVIKDMGFEPGTAIDSSTLPELLCEAEARCARERALRLLGYRERSVAELTRKLAEDGYSGRTVTAVVDRMVELGLVDDMRFARLWARGRVNAGYGPRRVLRELKERGLSPEVIDDAMTAEQDPDPVGRLRKSLSSCWPCDRKQRESCIRRLMARGFDIGIVLQVLEEPPVDTDIGTP
jgi:regulatory protein